MHALTIDSVTVYYQGNIRRGAVVLLHGNSLNSLIFVEQFRQIRTFPLLAIDLPGHGSSAKASDPAQSYNIPAYARLVAHILRELDLKDYILAGHALGGNIALEASILLPELRGLFLFSMCPFSLPPQFDRMCKPNPTGGYFLSGRLRKGEALLLAREMAGNAADPLVRKLAACILCTDEASRLGFAASLGLEHFSNEISLLESFQKPLALLLGTYDRFVDAGYLTALNPVSLWKNRIIELEAGHVPQLEEPLMFNSLMEEFYRDVLMPEGGQRAGPADAGKQIMP